MPGPHNKVASPSEGGSDGKRGHFGMEHWTYTQEVKDAARRRRGQNDDLDKYSTQLVCSDLFARA